MPGKLYSVLTVITGSPKGNPCALWKRFQTTLEHGDPTLVAQLKRFVKTTRSFIKLFSLAYL